MPDPIFCTSFNNDGNRTLVIESFSKSLKNLHPKIDKLIQLILLSGMVWYGMVW